MISARYPIELHQWYQCSVEIYGQKLTLILDEEPPIISYELFSSNILWPRSFTLIGLLSYQYQSNHSYVSEGFRRGIRRVKSLKEISFWSILNPRLFWIIIKHWMIYVWMPLNYFMVIHVNRIINVIKQFCQVQKQYLTLIHPLFILIVIIDYVVMMKNIMKHIVNVWKMWLLIIILLI